MKLECPDCRNIVEFGAELSGQKAPCPKCGNQVDVPATSVTAAPVGTTAFKDNDIRAKRARSDDEETWPERRPRPEPASSRGSGLLILVILLAVGLPLILITGCVGLGFMFSMFGVARHEVFVADEAMVLRDQKGAKVAVREVERMVGENVKVLPDEQGPNDDPNNPLKIQPVLNDIKGLNGFVAENLKPNDHAGPLAPGSKLWEKIGAAVNLNRLTPSGLVRGEAGDVIFRETAPDNGILIGFFVAAPENRVVQFLQPIYLTSKGEKTGKAFGMPDGQVVCLKAKRGYAVGAIDIRAGEFLDAIRLRFMRVQGDTLDVNDWYQSPRLGGIGGEPVRIGGDGAPIVGIHGRSLGKAGMVPAGSITALGVLAMK